MIKRLPLLLSSLVISIGLVAISAGCDSSQAIATVTARAAGTNAINMTLSPAPIGSAQSSTQSVTLAAVPIGSMTNLPAGATADSMVTALPATVSASTVSVSTVSASTVSASTASMGTVSAVTQVVGAPAVGSLAATSAATFQTTPLGGFTSIPSNVPGLSATPTPGSTAIATVAATVVATFQTTPIGGVTNAPTSGIALSTGSATGAATLNATATATSAATLSLNAGVLAPQNTAAPQTATQAATLSAAVTATAAPIAALVRDDTRWFSDAVMYSVFVRSFRDSNGDGIGDLQGVIDGLDYIQSLGANTIWLLPVFKSPSYHGYDTSDYYTVNPDYGTNDDLIRLIRAVHQRHMHILLDYVVNHTSDQHPYFKDALGNPASQYADYYTWLNKDHTQYATFASVKNMPTLNYDSPKTRQFAIDIALHWMDPLGSGDLSAGVDGYRCDVATGPPHDFWAQLRAVMTAKNPHSLLLGEIWVSIAKTIQSYLNGDQFDAAFDFPLYTALGGNQDKDGDGALAGTSPALIGGVVRSATKLYAPDAHLVRFTNNHDTNRVLSDVNGDMARARAAAVFELTVPETPVLYYGEELGMKGDKGGAPWYDAYRREPLPWYASLKGSGQTNWFAPSDANNKPNSGVSVEEEAAKPDSLLTLYRTLGTLRANNSAFHNQYDLPILSGSQRDLYLLRDWDASSLFITVINFSKSAITWTPGDVTTINGVRYTMESGTPTLSQGITTDGTNWIVQPAGYAVFRAAALF